MNPDNGMTLADLCEALQKDEADLAAGRIAFPDHERTTRIVETHARIVATVMKAYEDGHPYVDFGTIAPDKEG